MNCGDIKWANLMIFGALIEFWPVLPLVNFWQEIDSELYFLTCILLITQKPSTETILILINYTIIQAQTSHKKSFQDNYNLGQNMSVDEAMVKGRSPNHLKQYMPMTTNDKGRLTHHKHRCNHSHSVEKHKERDTKDDWRHHCLCHCPTRS